MKRVAIVGAVIIGVLVVFVGLVWLRVSAGRPESLIQRLRHAEGREREELLMRLSLSRGDVMSHLSEAFYDTSHRPAFRADVLELLFKRTLRGTDASLEDIVRDAVKDPAVEVRRAAARGVVQYGGKREQVALVDCIGDPDPQVRRQAYLLFGEGASHMDPLDGAYGRLSKDQRREVADVCERQMANESDPELSFLARAVVGREVEIRSFEADMAFGRGEVIKARKLLESALELHPQSKQARVRLVRHYLQVEDMVTALNLGRQHGALIEVPRLSEVPVIDGDPSEPVWQEAYRTDKFYHTTSRWAAKETTGKSRLYLGHRNGTIYLAMLGFEDDLSKLVVRHKARDSNVWRDDCVELFFDPGAAGKMNTQFVFNAAGAAFDQRHNDNRNNYSFQHDVGIYHDRGYWAVEFAISAEELTGKPLSAESIWAGNFFRTRIGPGSEQGAIWPCFGFSLRSALYPLMVFKDVETAPHDRPDNGKQE